MNTASGRYPGGDLRVSDADRDAALAELSEHFQAGRLTSDELDERVGKALTARTGKELAALTVDLPELPGHGPADPAPTHYRARRGGLWRWAITLAVIGIVVSSLAGPGHVRGALFPWWLIPIGLLVWRRVVRGCGHGARPDPDTRP